VCVGNITQTAVMCSAQLNNALRGNEVAVIVFFREYMNFHFTNMFYMYCPIWVKFIAVDHKMLLSDFELCISQCNDSHTLSKTVNKFLYVIPHFLSSWGWNLV